MPRPTQNACGDHRPTFSHRSLVAVAIWCALNKQAKLEDIYEYYRGQFLYYRRHTGTWKSSIKKTLSTNKCFMRLPEMDAVPRIDVKPNSLNVIWTLHPIVLRHEIFANHKLLWQRDPFKLNEHNEIRLDRQLVDLDNTLIGIQCKFLNQSTTKGVTSSLNGKQSQILCTPAQPHRRWPAIQRRHITSGNIVNRPSNVIRPVPMPATLVPQPTPLETLGKLLYVHKSSAVKKMLKQKVGGYSLAKSVENDPYTMFPIIRNIHQLRYLGYTETFFPIDFK